MKPEKHTCDNATLGKLLAELNLTVAARKLQDLLTQAQLQQASYSQFLADILSCELAGRLERKLSRSLKRSHLGPVKSLDEFDFSVRHKLAAASVKELLECQWIDQGRSILCLGRSGTGKTHVAKSLGYAACMKGYSVLYDSAAHILEILHASLADNTFHKVFQRYARVDLLIAEDISYLPIDQVKADHLFRLVSARHPYRPMIVTANTGFENWGKFFPNQAQAIATIDRLIDRATILRFTGKGFRKPRDIFGDSIDDDEN